MFIFGHHGLVHTFLLSTDYLGTYKEVNWFLDDDSDCTKPLICRKRGAQISALIETGLIEVMQLRHKLNGYAANRHVLRQTYIMYE